MKFARHFLKAALVLSSTAAFAHNSQQEHHRHEDLNSRLRSFAHDEIQKDHDRNRNNTQNRKNPPAAAVNCGDTITSSMTLGNDLNCPSFSGFALRIIGDNIKVYGNGHKINAPNAAAGVFTQGKNISISKLKVTGIQQGFGLLAYNSPEVRLENNDFSQNMIGINLYAENMDIDKSVIRKNKIQSSGLFGIRTNTDGVGQILSPSISDNDLRQSGDYALWIEAALFDLSSEDDNRFSGSRNGIYFKSGKMKLHDFSLAEQAIERCGVFVDSAETVHVKNVNLSSTVASTPLQNRVGLDLYKVDEFNIEQLTARANDVGLKFETEGGVSSHGSVKNCRFSHNSFAGIDIVSYDETEYGKFKLYKNQFQESSTAYDIFVHDQTEVQIMNVMNEHHNDDHHDGHDDHDGHEGHDSNDGHEDCRS